MTLHFVDFAIVFCTLETPLLMESMLWCNGSDRSGVIVRNAQMWSLIIGIVTFK